jgi:diacylglycerol kinase
MPKRFLISFAHALRGLRHAWNDERNFRIQVVIAVVVCVWMVVLNFSAAEFLFVMLAISLVISAELLNTIVENLLDHIEPNEHPTIGKMKDLMAGIVLISACTAALIGLTTFGYHFWG